MPEVSKKSKVQLRKLIDESEKKLTTLSIVLYEFNIKINKELEDLKDEIDNLKKEFK